MKWKGSCTCANSVTAGTGTLDQGPFYTGVLCSVECSLFEAMPLTLQTEACRRLPGLTLSKIKFFQARSPATAFSCCGSILYVRDAGWIHVSEWLLGLARRLLLCVCCAAQCQKSRLLNNTTQPRLRPLWDLGTVERNLIVCLFSGHLLVWELARNERNANVSFLFFHSFSFSFFFFFHFLSICHLITVTKTYGAD